MKSSCDPLPFWRLELTSEEVIKSDLLCSFYCLFYSISFPTSLQKYMYNFTLFISVSGLLLEIEIKFLQKLCC